MDRNRNSIPQFNAQEAAYHSVVVVDPQETAGRSFVASLQGHSISAVSVETTSKAVELLKCRGCVRVVILTPEVEQAEQEDVRNIRTLINAKRGVVMIDRDTESGKLAQRIKDQLKKSKSLKEGANKENHT